MTYIQNVIMNYVTDFISGREGLTGAPLKMVTHVKVQSEFEVELVHLGDADHQQSDHDHRHPHRRCAHSRARAGHGRASACDACGSHRDHALEDPGQWHRHCGCDGNIAGACRQWWLQVPVAGSSLLFLGGACFYVFTVAALGIALGTIASTMAQFGLLSIPVLLVMMLLSGSTTPMESMPVWLKYVMKVISPTPHFVIFAQDVLYRGADASIVWPEILAMLLLAASISVLRCTAFAASSSAAELRGKAAGA